MFKAIICLKCGDLPFWEFQVDTLLNFIPVLIGIFLSRYSRYYDTRFQVIAGWFLGWLPYKYLEMVDLLLGSWLSKNNGANAIRY